MSKRTPGLPRRQADAYMTWDPRAVRALLPWLRPATRFAEPCVGAGHLLPPLVAAGHVCTHVSDLPTDACSLPWLDGASIITNPPWTRSVLHAMIAHFVTIAPEAWLLFDADWCQTKQARPLLPLCSDIVPAYRLRWIEGSDHDGKDACAWYRFSSRTDGLGPRIRT